MGPLKDLHCLFIFVFFIAVNKNKEKYKKMSPLATAGVAVGASVGTLAVLALSLFGIRRWIRGPTKGTDNPKRLDNRVVVITGRS